MKTLRQHLFTFLRIAFGLGLLIYLGASGMIDWRALAGLGHAWPLSLAALGLIALAGMVLIAWRLCLLMRPHGLQLSLAASIRLNLIGLFFNTCLPGSTGGDVVKIYYAMEGNRGRRLEIATIMMLDRVAGLLGILGFTLLLVPFFQPMLTALPVMNALLWAAGGVLVIVLTGMWCCTSDQAIWRRAVAWIAQALPGGDYLERVINTLRVYRAHIGSCCQVVGVSMSVHLCMTLGTLFVIQATHPVGADSRMMLLIPMGFVANSLPVTPGGLGVGEAAFDQLFQMAGFTGGAVAILGWRVLMMIIGLPGIVFYLLDKKQAVVPEQTPLTQKA
ncbi:lysylphosphatidylglycerol synthase transmembrane domain-containing protein [Candidatus Entotheonella palauensis]|uniref:lysylphosphatidylglycerol synthase transmembrane domain-containing protein n=1 Tax=Candidatus Entotheonella palauensis TaxID=93172 RepID=UPI000B7E3BAB|nr:lysylphosphatidylglycerol synthase transmembrane domain-containing protein [Candidatus Entotheonella palauensis]